MKKIKLMYWAPVLVFVGAFVLGTLLEEAYVTYLEVAIISLLVIFFQIELCHMNVHSSRLYSAHLVSCGAWAVIQTGLILALVEWEKLSVVQWLICYSPIVLSLVPPMLYRRYAVEGWAKPMMIFFLFYTLLAIFFIGETGYYRLCFVLQMLMIAFATLSLPKNGLQKI